MPKSVVGLKAGDQVTVEDLLHGLLINSGNDCAEALACAYPGGRDKFIEMMNEKVHSLGTRSTHFYTPSGLDQKVDHPAEGKKVGDVDSNVSTAREIAEIAREPSPIRSFVRFPGSKRTSWRAPLRRPGTGKEYE